MTQKEKPATTVEYFITNLTCDGDDFLSAKNENMIHFLNNIDYQYNQKARFRAKEVLEALSK